MSRAPRSVVRQLSKDGSLGKVYQLFGDSPNATIEELNETLAA